MALNSPPRSVLVDKVSQPNNPPYLEDRCSTCLSLSRRFPFPASLRNYLTKSITSSQGARGLPHPLDTAKPTSQLLPLFIKVFPQLYQKTSKHLWFVGIQIDFCSNKFLKFVICLSFSFNSRINHVIYSNQDTSESEINTINAYSRKYRTLLVT